MNFGFFVSCLLPVVFGFDGRLFKHFSEPKQGGFLDIIKKPKFPLVNIHISKGIGGFGAGASIGSFGFGFGFGGQYVPPGGGNKPLPELPHVPDEIPHIPDSPSHIPDPRPHIPDARPHIPDARPHVPDARPHIPDPKPHLPGVTWEEEKGRPRPNWEEYEEDEKRDSKKETGYPKHEDSYEENNKEDSRLSWEDIGEINRDDTDSKSENFMNGDLINEGFIQPRLKKNRNRRFIQSHIYHVPIVFRSNAKPYRVKFGNSLNGLIDEASEK